MMGRFTRVNEGVIGGGANNRLEAGLVNQEGGIRADFLIHMFVQALSVCRFNKTYYTREKPTSLATMSDRIIMMYATTFETNSIHLIQINK